MRSFQCLAVLLLIQLVTSALSQAGLINDTTDVDRAIAAIETLQQWYNESTGLWDTTGWWNSANALTVLADFGALNSNLDNVTRHVFQNTYRQAQQVDIDVIKIMTPRVVESYTSIGSNPDSKALVAGFPGFINDYYDDEGWWALAWLKVYDLTNQTQYLNTSMAIFEDMTKGWGAPCNGMWWNKAHTYTGAIENELFLTVAAQLANRASNKQFYLSWALKQWNWFQHSGMINAQYNINNGLNLTTCVNDNGTIWSYNQGVILGGLLELNKAAPNDSYLAIAEKIAAAGIEHLSDTNGILHDPCEPNCGADGPQFKGVFLRNLQKLQQAVPSDSVKTFIEQNAESIWANDRSNGDQLGVVWSGPFADPTAATQSSAGDALVAVMASNDAKGTLYAYGSANKLLSDQS